MYAVKMTYPNDPLDYWLYVKWDKLNGFYGHWSGWPTIAQGKHFSTKKRCREAIKYAKGQSDRAKEFKYTIVKL